MLTSYGIYITNSFPMFYSLHQNVAMAGWISSYKMMWSLCVCVCVIVIRETTAALWPTAY